MTIYFSHDPVAFWDSSVHANIPPGAVVVTEAQYASLLMGQAAGMVIVPSSTGAPILIDPPPPTPAEVLAAERAGMIVMRWQARAVLRLEGLFEAADEAIRGSGDPILIEAWDGAAEFRRLSPSIINLGALLSLPPERIDDLFRAAAGITA